MSAPRNAGAPDPRTERQIRNLKALLDLTKAMAAEIRLDALLPIIMQKTTEILDADRSTLFLYDVESDELWSRVAQGLDSREIRIPASKGLAGYVARTRETVNIREAYADPRFNPNVDRETAYQTESLLCMPVVNNRGELTGVLQVLNKREHGEFSMDDEELLDALVAHVCVALERALLVEAYADQQRLRESLRVARDIQQSMLPSAMSDRLTKWPVEVSARMVPAAEVGGDFYDYIMAGEDSLAFCIGDVSGKGVPAALLMAVARSVLRSLMRAGLPPDECLQQANTLLRPECPRSMFVTALVGQLNLRTGELAYSVAGHLPPFLLPSEGSPELLERTGGIGLCLLQDFRYVSRRISLHRGEGIFLYTDGLTEAMDRNGEMFGQEGVAGCLAQVTDASAAHVIQHVHEAVVTFSAGADPRDDVTSLAVYYRGSNG